MFSFCFPCAFAVWVFFVVRVPDWKLRECLREAEGHLVSLRNPRNGVRNINGPFPLLSPGPYHRIHYDQYEKLWNYGIIIYAGRDRHSRYSPCCAAMRNKSASSVLLVCLSGVEHMWGIYPLTAQFDKGTEPADFQAALWENIGPNSVYTGECKRNTPIEGWWRIYHDKVIWIFRLELYHLQTIQLLDNLNPMHLSVVWFTYSHIVQAETDEFVSTYNAKKMYVQSLYSEMM